MLDVSAEVRYDTHKYCAGEAREKGSSMAAAKTGRALRKRIARSRHINSLRLILVLFLVISGALWLKTWSVHREVAEVVQAQEKVTVQIEEEKRNQEAIQEKVDYLRSDAYIEDLAREKLGLIYENEIIFKKQR